MQLFVFCEGVLAVVLCGCLFLYFIRSHRAIGRAVALDKLAEGFLSFMTLLFSIFVHGLIHVPLTDRTIAIMRGAMFAVSITCSIHLALAVRSTVREADRQDQDQQGPKDD